MDFLHRALGRTEIPVFRLGLSASYWPGKRTVHRALDEGLNYFFCYGIDRQMITVLREVFRSRREACVVATGAYSYWWWHQDLKKAQFLRSKPFPEKLQNFINSWLGEPWVEKSTRVESNRILELCDDRPRGVVPVEAIALTAGVDCQLNGFYYVIRAWARSLTSWLVREGFVEEFWDLEQVLFGSEYFRGNERERLFVNLTCIDSGYRTDEVYKWARRHSGYVKAIKGATHALKAPFVPSRIDYNRKGKIIPGGLILWLLDTAYWKDVLLRRLQMHREDPGAWIEHAEITRGTPRGSAAGIPARVPGC